VDSPCRCRRSVRRPLPRRGAVGASARLGPLCCGAVPAVVYDGPAAGGSLLWPMKTPSMGLLLGRSTVSRRAPQARYGIAGGLSNRWAPAALRAPSSWERDGLATGLPRRARTLLKKPLTMYGDVPIMRYGLWRVRSKAASTSRRDWQRRSPTSSGAAQPDDVPRGGSGRLREWRVRGRGDRPAVAPGVTRTGLGGSPGRGAPMPETGCVGQDSPRSPLGGRTGCSRPRRAMPMSA
jgi:hypothetical protein